MKEEQPIEVFPRTTLDDVFGVMSWAGRPFSVEEMNEAVALEARWRWRREQEQRKTDSP